MASVFPPKSFNAPHALAEVSAGTPVLLGFSGGADSTALLHMLCLYGKQTGAPIYAAHVHHGIRGIEADRDEEFCRSVAETLGVKIFVLHADVPALAKQSGESVETTARYVRYEFFDRLMQEHQIPLLVTAHNANDNLETMLFHLARGSGLEGLCGIPVSRSCRYGTLVRPILGMAKSEILQYCEANGLTYVTDSTNTDMDYMRNRIRSEIIPPLLSINSAAVPHASQLAERLRADQLYLEQAANEFLEKHRKEHSLNIQAINGASDAITHRALRTLYRELTHSGVLEHSHVLALRQLSARAVPHSSVTLPHGIEAVIENGWLQFQKKEALPPPTDFFLPLSEGKNRISQISCEIIMGTSQNTKNIYKNSIQFSMDSAKINGTLYARNRKAGDRIFLGGMHKSVKKLLSEKKVPLSMRQRLPILCDNNGIVAVPTVGIRDGVAHRLLPENRLHPFRVSVSLRRCQSRQSRNPWLLPAMLLQGYQLQPTGSDRQNPRG